MVSFMPICIWGMWYLKGKFLTRLISVDVAMVFLYDLAAVMLSLVPYQRFKVLQGYESIRSLGSDYFQSLECFFIMIMMENYSHHASNPRETESIKGEQIYALAYIHEYLHGRPFLLNVVEPIEIDDAPISS